MSAAHFLDDATFYEVKAFLDGAAQRIYDDYNRTRLLMFTVVKALGSKLESPEELLHLDGDPKPKERHIDSEELEKLKQMAKQIELKNVRDTNKTKA